MFSAEHLVLAFVLGLVTGVVSTSLLRRKGVTLEMTVSLLIMSIWLIMHAYGFLFDVTVPWLFDFAGFGAAGNFIGVSIKDVSKVVWRGK